MDTIFLTVFIMTSIITLLTILISLANSIIADYGEQIIKINSDKELNVEGGKSILSSLVDNKIFIPSACGGKGSCGYCKCKVNKGAGPVLATELSYLDQDEQKNNIRLTCQVKVKDTIEMEIPEEFLNVKQFKGKIKFIKDLTPTIKHLCISILDGETIDFKPGQYIQFKAPKYPGNKEEVFRAYSIASPPSKKDEIELLIGYVEGGIATTYIHKHLNEGDNVIFNGPFGDFYLSDTNEDMTMVAVGTGMAPIRSILYHIKEKNIKRNIEYFFGARKAEDLFMVDEMKELENEIGSFKYIPVLSRPDESDNWDGEKGRVTNLIDKYLEKTKEDCKREAYLCGSAPMIDSTEEALINKGIKSDNIFYDKFD